MILQGGRQHHLVTMSSSALTSPARRSFRLAVEGNIAAGKGCYCFIDLMLICRKIFFFENFEQRIRLRGGSRTDHKGARAGVHSTG